MVGIIEASATLGSIKSVLELAKGMQSLKTTTEINQAIIDIQRALLEAQSSAFDDKEMISTLRHRIRELENDAQNRAEWQRERDRYVLTASQLGAYTYDLKPEHTDKETFHRLCATCFEEKVKSVLHTINKHSGGEIVHCAKCKADLKLSNFNNAVRTTRVRNEMW